MKLLCKILISNEESLMDSILAYAHRQGYVKYTSTLREAWRISIMGLTRAICDAMETDRDVELVPNEDYSEDPATDFGILEAERHRERGIPYEMFMGLFKYYRDSYCDLLKQQKLPECDINRYLIFVNRVFDRIEIAFSRKWFMPGENTLLHELQNANAVMTNEKNMYLTIVESLSSPVFFINRNGDVVYINMAASRLLNLSHVPGSFYYNRDHVKVELPLWIKKHLHEFLGNSDVEYYFEEVNPEECGTHFMGRIVKMKDVSAKNSGFVVILSDITGRIEAEIKIAQQMDSLKKAFDDIRRLRGILPICSSCKKIRNDSGYWEQVESYIVDHSEAEFSHGLCPDCVKKLYPEYEDEE